MQHIKEVQGIMLDFAARTGLSDHSREPRRYLWTDAFAVCNFIELHRQSGVETFLLAARELVDQVHFVLGRYSLDDSRKGWLSGLDEQSGYAHPTIGGLRIGKKLPERRPDEPFDERLEWERDGQYFHYLSKWMHALAKIASYTEEAQYQAWALELAQVAHAGFTYRPAAGMPKRMYWKMSLDLSRPLVASMGHHDPLDALLTYFELITNNSRFDRSPAHINLDKEIADCQAMCESRNWATEDPLGTGGLLVDAWRLAQIKTYFDIEPGIELAALLVDCEPGLKAFMRTGIMDHPAEYRLAFRELGLSIGLHALAVLDELMAQNSSRFSLTERKQVARLRRFSFLSEEIEAFWQQPVKQETGAWREHADINAVMLVTSLAPESFLRC